MNQDHHIDPTDAVLDRAFPAHEPTPADLRRVEEIYERLTSKQRRGTLRWMAAAASIAVVAAAILLVQAGRPSSAEAALNEIAEVARLIEPLVVRSGEFVYTRAEAANLVTYEDDAGPIHIFLPEVTETWADGAGFFQLRRTVGTPIFFDSDMERRYYEGGFDTHQHIGETVTEQFENVTSMLDDLDWPTDPGELDSTFRSLGETGSDDEVFLGALSLIQEDFVSPELRAALVEVMAGLDVEVMSADENSVTLARAVQGDLPAREVHTVSLSQEGIITFRELHWPDGAPEIGIPPGTTVGTWTLLERSVVDNLD